MKAVLVLAACGVATPLAAARHVVDLRPRLMRESVSPMADFSATLTVRQLADLLVYLRRAP